MQALMQAVPYILNAAGGIFGKKKKYLDPETMKERYGAKAIADETQQIANFILNSPYGQELLKSAAISGQNFQTEMASRAAASGLDPSSGADSGASTFASGAASQAQGALEGQTKAGVWQSAMPLAAQNVAARAALEQENLAEQRAEPSTFQKIAAAAGGATQAVNASMQQDAALMKQAAGAAVGVPPGVTAAIQAPGELADSPSQRMVAGPPRTTRRRPLQYF